MDDNEKIDADPSEEEIKKLCKLIRKKWDAKQRKSRSVYKSKDYTVSIIKISDIESEYY